MIVAKAVADHIGDQRWYKDVLSRKLTIAQGEGRVHGARYNLEDWGLTDLQETQLTAIAEKQPIEKQDKRAQLTNYLQSLNLKHFKPYEFMMLGDVNDEVESPCYQLNHLPSMELWQNVEPLARVLDELRAQLDAPIVLTSIYRSPAYNACVGGVPKSQHKLFRAADFHVKGGSSPAEWASVLIQMRNEGIFSGWVKPYKTFVHVDTRGTSNIT